MAVRTPHPKLIALAVALTCLTIGVSGQGQPPVSVAFLYSDGNLPGTLKAFKSILDERPDL